MVQKASTETAVASSVNPSEYGQTVTFTASVTSTAGVPDGTVTFADETTLLAELSLSGGIAAYSTSGLPSGAHTITVTFNDSANYGSSSATLSQIAMVPPPPAPDIPGHLRADISVGTTGQLLVSWDPVTTATYYSLERSLSPDSGYTVVDACSGLANLQRTQTYTGTRLCRDGNLDVGSYFYYRVQACNANACSDFSTPVSNTPVASDCTTGQMPDLSDVRPYATVKLLSSTVDPAITFLPTNYQLAAFAAPGVARRDLLVVTLPASGSSCGMGAFENTATKLGFDLICVNYSNAASQIVICDGDAECFGNISQAKFDASGACSVPNGMHCGVDPTTGLSYVNSNPSDAITQRISTMLQYLNSNGYNLNGTDWGNYLSGTTPRWDKMIIGGHSQGGAMATFAAYQQVIARAVNLSAPPGATPISNVMTAGTFFGGPRATDIRNFYGFVSTNDLLYKEGRYSAVWSAMGFTAANDDGEVQLNTAIPVGLNCNSGTPSHNFSTSAPVSPGGGHNDTLYLWNEDIFKFMLID
jgi:hypothetical protein